MTNHELRINKLLCYIKAEEVFFYYNILAGENWNGSILDSKIVHVTPETWYIPLNNNCKEASILKVWLKIYYFKNEIGGINKT